MTADLQMVTLITVIANLIVTPLLQYMLQSKCDKISCCCGLIDLHGGVTIDDQHEVKQEGGDIV